MREWQFTPNNPQYACLKVSDVHNGASCNISKIAFGTHIGTHIDALSHFMQNGITIDRQLSLERGNGKAKVFHIEEPVITDFCLEQYEIEEDDIVIFKTNNSKVLKERMYWIPM